MLNRHFVVIVLLVLNAGVDVFIASRFGLASVNNWLLIVSMALLSLAAYQVLGIVEGYKDEHRV